MCLTGLYLLELSKSKVGGIAYIDTTYSRRGTPVMSFLQIETYITKRSGTQLTYQFEGDAKKRLFKLVMPLVLPMVKRRVKNDFQRLKVILESRS